MHRNPRIIFKDFFSQCVKFDKFRFTKTELSLVYKNSVYTLANVTDMFKTLLFPWFSICHGMILNPI